MFLDVKNIVFSYDGDRKVLDDISFTLSKGETIAIVGASGCGKSTLLKLISGILNTGSTNLSQGSITIDGLSADEYRKAGKLAFMFQEPTLMPNLTVRQNIELPLRINKIANKQKVEDLLQTVGLSEFGDYLPKQLSGGMKTRVALARSFASEPEFLLLDEPFSALDIAWKSKLYNELQLLRVKYKTTAIIVTHDVQEALLLSNIVIVLNHKGVIIAENKVSSSIYKYISDRVLNISSFVEEVYKEHFIPIQQWIMDDGTRGSINRNEAYSIINEIYNAAGTDREYNETLLKNTILIRDYTNSPEINTKLYEAFNKAVSNKFKYEILWDILNYKQLPVDVHHQLFDFYFSNLEEFSKEAYDYYKRDGRNLFNFTIYSRIKQRDIPNTKKWIYLCDLYASDEIGKVQDYLLNVIVGEIEELNYPFAREVAQKLKRKIENEKKVDIPVA